MVDFINKVLLVFIIFAPTAYLVFIIYRFKLNIRKLFLPLIFLFLLLIIFFNKNLFYDQTFAAQDFNNIQIPLMHFFRESIFEYGQPPIWNSRFGGGFDAFANPMSTYFSPFNFLLLLSSDVYLVANIFIFFQLFLISLFSLLLFKELKFSTITSLFGAIVFTFNGFVTMRLSPGVGIEYLYVYKWIPLILLFTILYFRERRISDLVFLGLVFGLSFEGNLNMVIALWFFWGLFWFVLSGKQFFKNFKCMLLVPALAFTVYAIKLIPFIDLMQHSTGRISEVVTDWRVDKIPIMDFLSYFPPFRHLFGAALFTPGSIATIFFLVCLVCLTYSVLKKKRIDMILRFCALSIFIGFILVTNNRLSNSFFLLFPFNRVTIIPAFMIFVFVPMYIMVVYGFHFVSEFFLKFASDVKRKFIISAILIGICCSVYAEILLGPSIFGNNTYSFNFAKMHKKEIFEVPPYNALSKLEPGIFIFKDNPNVFLYPYQIPISNLYTLNSFKYFYSPSDDGKLLANGNTADIGKYVDYILSTKKIDSEGLKFLSTISMESLLSDFESFSIQDKFFNYRNLRTNLNWDEKLYLYKVNNKVEETVFIKRTDNNPVFVPFTSKNRNISGNVISTAVKYSKWWRSDKNRQLITSDDYGYLQVANVIVGEKVILYYFNPYIYVGLVISMIGFAAVVYGGLLRKLPRNQPLCVFESVLRFYFWCKINIWKYI